MARVSLLMPAYNAGNYIREAIDSIRAQTFSGWELVVVNDGSTDDTEAIILSYDDARIRYYSNGENRGLAYTRNRLLELAGGEMLAFLDSDDIAFPERLEVQVNYLDKHPDVALVGASLYGLSGAEVDKRSFVFDLSPLELPVHLLFYNPVSTSSVMLRRSVLSAGHFRADYPPVEDYDLWTRILYENRAAVLPDVLGCYRLHGSSISKTLSAASYANRDRVVLNQLEHYFPGEIPAEEKEIHLSLVNFHLHKHLSDIPALEAWIGKLLDLNGRHRHFDGRILARVLYERVLKKFLRLDGYDRSVIQTLLRLKRTLKPQQNWELRKKELAILAFSLAGKKFIATD